MQYHPFIAVRPQAHAAIPIILVDTVRDQMFLLPKQLCCTYAAFWHYGYKLFIPHFLPVETIPEWFILGPDVFSGKAYGVTFPMAVSALFIFLTIL